jgi:endonuclease IV
MSRKQLAIRRARVHRRGAGQRFRARTQSHLRLNGFRNFLNDPRLADLPGLLETDKSDDLHEDIENLARLRSLIE